MSFTPLNKILPKALQQMKLKAVADAALVCEKYRQLAPHHVHSNALDYTFPKHFKGKTLTIGVTDSAWAGQVLKQKEDLLKALNETIGKKMVASIKTRVAEKIRI